MALCEEKGLTVENMIQILEAALRRLPSEPDGTIPQPTETNDSTGFIPTRIPPEEMSPTTSAISHTVLLQETSPVSQQEMSPSSLSGSGSGHSAARRADVMRDDASSGSVEDAVSPNECMCCNLLYPDILANTFVTCFAVYHLLCKQYRLCSHALWSPDLLHAV